MIEIGGFLFRSFPPPHKLSSMYDEYWFWGRYHKVFSKTTFQIRKLPPPSKATCHWWLADKSMVSHTFGSDFCSLFRGTYLSILWDKSESPSCRSNQPTAIVVIDRVGIKGGNGNEMLTLWSTEDKLISAREVLITEGEKLVGGWPRIHGNPGQLQGFEVASLSGLTLEVHVLFITF